MQSTM